MKIKLLVDGKEVIFHNDVRIIVEDVNPDNYLDELHLILNGQGEVADYIRDGMVLDSHWRNYEDILTR